MAAADLVLQLVDARLEIVGEDDSGGSGYRAAVEAKPDLFAAWMNLGGTLMLMERVDEAVRAYEGALRAQPGDAAALKNLDFARNQLHR